MVGRVSGEVTQQFFIISQMSSVNSKDSTVAGDGFVGRSPEVTL
jgi:hypothetical protein